MKKFSCLLILAAVFTSTAWAGNCKFPDTPKKFPDGKTAKKEEMVAARETFKQYNDSMTSFLACLKAEYLATLAKNPRADEDLKKELLTNYTEENDDAVDRAQMVAEKLNAQVRAYQCHQEGKADKCGPAK